jgi:isoleucyl-tRNA synthetase
MKKYREYEQFDLSEIAEEIREFWKEDNTFAKSMETRASAKPFVFYEGPPSANGKPGIHHVMSRTIKDLFCRYKTLQGYQVNRKAGWDTHGLPVEISVEKTLGITKEDIGTKISVEAYNAACRKEVMKYKDLWGSLTEKMGYWVDLDNPYITFESKYIESVWHLLKRLHDKGLLYKGYTIQPYSPAAGTGLSTHELNQPGCYKDVKDTTVTAQLKVIKEEKSAFLFENTSNDVFFLAWTTTPWTLPSNTALAVGPKITYVEVETFNQYTGIPITVVLAKDLLKTHFKEESRNLPFEDYQTGNKNVPWKVVREIKGANLENIRYEQLAPWVRPMGDAFRVILGDFVTTGDGTGIVHIAPTFGADDARVGQKAGIAPLHLIDKEGDKRPMVDLQGRFFKVEDLDEQFVEKYVNTSLYSEYAGRYVKNDYNQEATKDDPVLDIDLAVMFKKNNEAFKVEKYTHNYPHCWRTDKPVLYYPMDSWFVKTTDYKKRMLELNDSIKWKPASTGQGRFANWLENLVDWNLSRSRYWGIPLPVWVTEDKKEQVCVGSVRQLKEEIEKSVAAGIMQENPLADFDPEDMSRENYEKVDLHRPYMDEIVLVAASGKAMYREKDLIDVWFDSGSMPYAQLHYPFENREAFEQNFPADFIAEGVDQTRGWFFTLHAIATMVFDSVAYKTVVSNGLVLDKEGNKMSKRLGNTVEPITNMSKYGPDATRWYMVTNAQPWDNLKFSREGVDELRRKFFGTLYNTYSFFALYANIDGFSYHEDDIPFDRRPELDRWILSELNTLIKNVQQNMDDYEPTRAGRYIQQFVYDHLSNWYVRLSRRRFWKGDYSEDKISAYQTLYRCLKTVAVLMSPIAPFYSDRLFKDLNDVSGQEEISSVHLATFPAYKPEQVDKDLEERMQLAQKISSQVLSLRKKSEIRVRQPLNKIMLPLVSERFKRQVEKVKDLILSEVNIKDVEFLSETSGVLVKRIKPDFKALGPKYGKLMKLIAKELSALEQSEIMKLEQNGSMEMELEGQAVIITTGDVEIITEDIPGLVVSTMNNVTVALDITITKELREEGLAREIVNRIQNIRKDQGFEVTDTINVKLAGNYEIASAVENNFSYICSETLAKSFNLVDSLDNSSAATEVVLEEGMKALIEVVKE